MTQNLKTKTPGDSFLKAVGKLRRNLSVLQAASAECVTNAEDFSATWDSVNDVHGVSSLIMAEMVLTKIHMNSCKSALREAQISLEKVYEE